MSIFKLLNSKVIIISIIPVVLVFYFFTWYLYNILNWMENITESYKYKTYIIFFTYPIKKTISDKNIDR